MPAEKKTRSRSKGGQFVKKKESDRRSRWSVYVAEENKLGIMILPKRRQSPSLTSTASVLLVGTHFCLYDYNSMHAIIIIKLLIMLFVFSFSAMLHTGLGEKHVSTFLSALEIPSLHHKTMKQREREMGRHFIDTAKASCAAQLVEEEARARR